MYYHNVRAFSNVSVSINPGNPFSENLVVAYNKLIAIEQALVLIGFGSPANHDVPSKMDSLAVFLQAHGNVTLHNAAKSRASDLRVALRRLRGPNYNNFNNIVSVKAHSYPNMRYATNASCSVRDVFLVDQVCDNIINLLVSVVNFLNRTSISYNVSFV